MAALLVRLKLTLLRNSLRRSTWRLVGLIVGTLYGLVIVALVVAGLVVLRRTSVSFTADVTETAFALLAFGWLAFSLLVFGVDETVDPAKFALLPLRARDLRPGLLAAGLVGVPGVATVLIGVGLVLTWARTLPLTLVTVAILPVGVATCVLLSRVGTSAFAALLSTRRFRDLAFIALALFGAGMGVAANVVSSLLRDFDRLRSTLATLARILGWTPFGWVWAVPADVARGRWPAAAVHLLLGLLLVAALWRAWGHFLDRRLTEPVEAGGSAGKVQHSSFIDRICPSTPVGGIAARALRYWRRDPRYLAGIAGFLVAPLIIIVTQLLNPRPFTPLIALAPALLGLVAGLSFAQDLSYDGSALWLHLAAGVSGRDDRRGRALSTLAVYLPLTVILVIVAMAASGAWRLLPMVVGLTFGLLLIGMGVGSLVGALWQWPAPPPGVSPFQRGNSGGLPALLAVGVTMSGTIVVGLPTIALVVWSFFTPAIGWLVLPVGLASGVLALRVGLVRGGALLDRRWPEVMQAVSERTG